MNDPFVVRCGQAACNLDAVVRSLTDGKMTAAADLFSQRFAVEQFGNEVGCALVGAELKNGDDVGVIERGGSTSFLLEAAKTVGVGGEIRKDFNRDVAVEVRVAGAVDFAHASGSDEVENFVGAKARSADKRHWSRIIAQGGSEDGESRPGGGDSAGCESEEGGSRMRCLPCGEETDDGDCGS
jgi:hypothetical protein